MRVFDPVTLRVAAAEALPRSAGLAGLAKWLLSESSRRRRLFPSIMLDEAAWEMMLDLFVQDQAGSGLATTSLCVAANVPLSTAIRYLNHLSAAGLVERTPDAHDRRRVMVSLSDETRARITEYLDHLAGAMRAQVAHQ